ncbi:MAG: HEAT repeat domain-containing protein [Elusimicrobia bacterium]|nr:HEAT repeat domain-containing protein [Elusimicrobiota bacterium]
MKRTVLRMLMVPIALAAAGVPARAGEAPAAPAAQARSVREAAMREVRAASLDAESEKALLRLLESPDDKKRQAARNTLVKARGERNVTALIGFLGSDESELRGAAERALEDMGGDAVPAILRAAERSGPAAMLWEIKVLGVIGDKRAVDFLVKSLRNPEEQIREKAVQALGRIAEPSTYKPVSALLGDPGIYVRTKALRALVQIDRDKAFGAALEMMKDRDPLARTYAVEAFGMIDKPAAVDAAIVALKDDSPRVREAAVAALKNMRGGKAITALREYRNSGDGGGQPKGEDRCAGRKVDVSTVIANYSGDARHMPEQHLWDALAEYGVCVSLSKGSLEGCAPLSSIHPDLKRTCEEAALPYLSAYAALRDGRNKYDGFCSGWAELARPKSGAAFCGEYYKLLTAASPKRCWNPLMNPETCLIPEMLDFVRAVRAGKGEDWRYRAASSRGPEACAPLSEKIMKMFCFE